MLIQIDSREHANAIGGIIHTFKSEGVQFFVSKLYVGDYMSYDNPRLVVDRKQNLGELCGNVCQQHDRFRREIIRANDAGIKIVFLCEHGKSICSLEDVSNWVNPRSVKRVLQDGKWVEVKQNVMQGKTLAKILATMERKYGVRFLFCNKAETGQKIIEILRGD